MFFPERGVKEETHATAARKVKKGFDNRRQNRYQYGKKPYLIFLVSYAARCVGCACVTVPAAIIEEALALLAEAAHGLGLRAVGPLPEPPVLGAQHRARIRIVDAPLVDWLAHLGFFRKLLLCSFRCLNSTARLTEKAGTVLFPVV